MVKVKGQTEVRQFLARLPADIEGKIIRGAARTGAKIIAAEAKALCPSNEVAQEIKVRTVEEDRRTIGKVQVDMGRWNLPLWLEYGTSAHFISVDDSQRGGLSVRKINEKTKEGSLVIGGKFVGDTVFHKGARPHPFMRPALDNSQGEAIAAAQAFINRRVSKLGITGQADEGDAE